MYQKLKEIYEQIEDHFNLFEVGRVISEFILKEFEAEACEIKCLGEDDVFFRVHFGLRKDGIIIHDQDEIEKIFGIKRTRLQRSIIGHFIKKDENFNWIEKDQPFDVWLEATTLPIDKESARRYAKNMPSGKIANFGVLTLHLPKTKNEKKSGITRDLKGCFHIFNFYNGSKDEKKIQSGKTKLLEIFPYISLILFNAIFYNRAKDEIDIDRQISTITTKGNTIQKVLEEVVSVFAEKLKSPLSTIWFPDESHEILVLHSFHIKTKFLSPGLGEEHIRNLIETKAPKLLKFSDSLSGELVTNRGLPWIKKLDITSAEHTNYKWHVVTDEIKTKQFVALPIRHADSTIAVIVLHPTLSERDFHQIPFYYFKSYSTQIATTIKYFIEKSFSENARLLSEKLTQLVRKKETVFYRELVHTIVKVLDAEACSIFEARGGDESERGVYLIASTDTAQARQKIGNKIYSIDSKSITGHVARTGESIIVYDVNKVHEFFPEIESMSTNFMEQTIRPHKSLIAVPIPGGAQNFDDRSTSILIIRCINKKTGPMITLTELFSVDDKHLLNYVGAILESFKKVIEVLYERNDLIDLIIHEIENPIVAIRGIVDTIKKKREDKSISAGRLDEKLDEIEVMALLLKGWMSNMDFLNQLMQGKQLPINRKKALLGHDIIKHTIYWMTPKLRNYGLFAKGVKVENVEPRLEVDVDNDHLKQVFYNLIGNALKYKKPGQVPKISIAFEDKNGDVAVKVKDWGVGVDDDHREKIFERGFRSRYARNHRVEGKGFGLWLCRELLKSNGLEIKLSSCREPTIVEVTIPRRFISYRKEER